MPALARRLPQLTPVASSDRAGALRRILVERFPDAVLLPDRVVDPLPTGLLELDHLLPGGGLPKGRMVAWKSHGGGATALLRAAARNLTNRGDRVAWIDGLGSLAGPWAEGPLVVRPADPPLALSAAEILLRSGGFALIVLSGADPDQQGMLRLSRMVHEGGGAFVALTDRTLTASLRLSSRFLPDQFRWATGPFGSVASVEAVTIEITAAAPGWSRTQTLTLPTTNHDLRLSLDPDLADRRGDLG